MCTNFLHGVVVRNKHNHFVRLNVRIPTIVVSTMGVYQKVGISVDIVGLKASSNGRSCENHACCGSALKVDSLVRFRVIQIKVSGKEETAIAVYWVSEGLDRCRVGFLPRYTVPHKKEYDGKLAQVSKFYEESSFPPHRAKSQRGKGVCRATLVHECPTPPRTPKKSTPRNIPRKRRRIESNDRSKSTEETT